MFRIKKLDIFIVKQFALLFLGTFFICQFVLMMQFLWRYVDELIGKGLSLEIMAQFFWYMGLMLIPQALPLAILLSSLISFGNLGESSELTAIKAAGVSLLQAFRPLIFIVLLIAGLSFYFQNIVAPMANQSFYRLLLGVKQKSPEVEIPEGIFYDGIQGSNIYVQKKDLKTGMLYGVMIYRQSGSYEDQAIILADSGMMQSTAEKKHLVLNLYSGEWFENMRSQDLANSAAVPYRRETFSTKRIVLDFDGGFNLADLADISGDARAKSLGKILHDMDSIREFNDSVGHAYYNEAQHYTYRHPQLSKNDSVKAFKEARSGKVNIDTIFGRLSNREKQQVVTDAMNSIRMSMTDMEFKGEYTEYLHRRMRTHQIEAIGKFTLALSCIIFFFIGAPLGAIIRKGGLGVPVIVSVLVFIVYFIFENSGMKMARDDQWTVWFGKLISTAVLTPIAVFFTYKANNDSVVFNIDLYKNLAMKLLGLRISRTLSRKEVIIYDPDYPKCYKEMEQLIADCKAYSDSHFLLMMPSYWHIFFRYQEDTTVAGISERLENLIDELHNSKNNYMIGLLNMIPYIIPDAHTRPFRNPRWNKWAGVILPVGLFFWLRIWRYRLRLNIDLDKVQEVGQEIMKRIKTIENEAA